MITKPTIIALDLEGTLVPEIWIEVAEKTGIEKLRLTTRDISDYDKLMKMRISILRKHNLPLATIQEIIGNINPFFGAKEFLDWICTHDNLQPVILSDTFYQFALPIISKLGHPILFCNSLVIDDNDMIIDYQMRQDNQKEKTIAAFGNLNFEVVAIGDSYNDTTMLKQADRGILFRAPEKIIKQFPQFKAIKQYEKLKKYILK
jgi:phosphoserine/homoserine phosphotransferase